MSEQTRAVKDMTTAAQNTSKPDGADNPRHREHSTVAAGILDVMKDIRKITDR